MRSPPEAHTHTIANVDGLQDALDGKQATGDYALKSDLDTYATKNELSEGLSPKADTTYVDEELAKKQVAGDYATNTALTSGLAEKLGKTEKAASATVADSATKAKRDASGNVISTTYATKTELGKKLDATAKAESAKVADAVTWTGVTGKPDAFPPSAHTHSTSQVTGLDSALSGKAPVSHTHTKSQITNFAHTHAISEVEGLQGELDGKQAAGDYATTKALTSGLAGKVDVSVYEAKIKALEARIAALEKAGFITSADLPTTADFVE